MLEVKKSLFEFRKNALLVWECENFQVRRLLQWANVKILPW